MSKSFSFEGDSILFESKSNTYSVSGYPEIEIKGNILTLSSSEKLETMDNIENKDLLFSKIENDLNIITKYVGYCNKMAVEFNNSIKKKARLEINDRKLKIGSFHKISEWLEIPIDIKKPKIIKTIEVKREILPLMAEKPNEINYVITDEIYTGTLSMIRHICSSFERTPTTFAVHSEEGLRDIILSQLNGVYKGRATGEGFRKAGKNDISIEFENRSAFVVECKIWKGIVSFKSALAQLFSYTTWRDTKLCLIIFSKNDDFFGVLEKIKTDLPGIDNFISHKEIEKNEFNVMFKRDKNREFLNVRVFVFDLSVNQNVS